MPACSRSCAGDPVTLPFRDKAIGLVSYDVTLALEISSRGKKKSNALDRRAPASGRSPCRSKGPGETRDPQCRGRLPRHPARGACPRRSAWIWAPPRRRVPGFDPVETELRGLGGADQTRKPGLKPLPCPAMACQHPVLVFRPADPAGVGQRQTFRTPSTRSKAAMSSSTTLAPGQPGRFRCPAG